MSEPRLELVDPCDHGALSGESEHKTCGLHYCTHDPVHSQNCPGGSRRVLDPEEVVLRGREILASDVGKTLMHATVQDIIEALAALEGRE